MLNGLDLFSGIGGITLALGEWVRPVAYCEIDPYPRGVLLSRMETGELPVAPVWDDIGTFKGKHWKGHIDIIYGGFPCQDISVAGKQAGLDGQRSGLFFEIMRLVSEIQPTYIFLENVPAINTNGLDQVAAEIAKKRYDCRWTTISAAEVGAWHKRERWFLLAHSKRIELREQPGGSCGKNGEGETLTRNNGTEESVAHSTSKRLPLGSGKKGARSREAKQPERHSRSLPDPHCTEESVAHSTGLRLSEGARKELGSEIKRSKGQKSGDVCKEKPGAGNGAARSLPDPHCTGMEGSEEARNLKSEREIPEQYFDRQTCLGGNAWATEPNVDRVVNGLPHRVDRIKSLGNAVVPRQAKEAFKELMGIYGV